MNRKERRIAAARGKAAAGGAPGDIAGLLAQATRERELGRPEQAEALCKQILAGAPAEPAALNLLGIVYQDLGRHRLAAKAFAKALAVDDRDAACHYNLAASYQALGERDAAAAQFDACIALGMGGKVLEDVLMQNPDVVACVRHAMRGAALPATGALFGAREIAAIAGDIFLRCALRSILLRGVALELLLTHLRLALLGLAEAAQLGPIDITEGALATFCALAQQCFINEYVFAQGDAETARAGKLKAALAEKLSAGGAVAPVLLAAVGSYYPLHSLATAEALLARPWPQCVVDLLRQQVSEPLGEARERAAIPVLTAVGDAISIAVMQQYEENPYPRWTLSPFDACDGGAGAPSEDILIAGCGTGRHALDVARQSPAARVLAVDISRPSLAYARRKTREAGARNIDYAQADILELAALGRSFDRIEAVGVLHHLADPVAGWRVLLGLLRPGGSLRLGLYSETARRAIVEARAIIAARGYQPTVEGIRALRQGIIRDRHEPRWKVLLATAEDFFSTSGCRDLFFNVMEHRFTIPQIADVLAAHALSFQGFEVDDKTAADFQRMYPGAGAALDLDRWAKFEAAQPHTFRNMYVFSVRKTG